MLEPSSAISVGVGGWAYFPSKTGNKLKLCAKIFDFVEVNSTFYKLPQEDLARKWRSSVPDEFQFSVRASGKLTHESHLEPSKENFRVYERNLSICKVLRAFVLHFQLPPSFEVTSEVIRKWRDFFSSLKKEWGMSFAIEVRNERSVRNPLLRSFLADYNIIPTSDPSKEEIEVSSKSRIQYSRIFGLGEHTRWSFSTDELEELKQKVLETVATKRYLTFHNITMYEDGARMKQLLKPGGKDFEGSVVGLDALKQVLAAERIVYPISGRELASKLAWRTIDVEDRRVHVDEFLKDLDDTRLETLEQVLDKAGRLLPRPDPGQRL